MSWETRRFTTDAIILPVNGYQILIGNDTLDPLGASINFKDHKISMKDGKESMHQTSFQTSKTEIEDKLSMPLIKKQEEISAKAISKHAFRLMAKDDITIPPWHHAMIQVEIKEKPPEEGTYYVNSMEPLAMKHGILAAAGIIDFTEGVKGIMIANMSKQPYNIVKNQQVAYITPIHMSKTHECLFVDNPEDTVPPPAIPKIETNLPCNLEEVDQQVRPKLEDLLTRYYDKICGTTERPIGRHTSIEVPVPTKADAKPVFIQPRRTAPKLEKFVKEELEKYLKFGFMSTTVSSWASPLVVAKKNGKMRLCVDYRKLNEVIEKDVYPMPRTDDTLHAMHGAKYFSVMDLFFQQPWNNI